MREYYEAYDERYKTIHQKGGEWFGCDKTPIVCETMQKYGIGRGVPILEIGCGEGRDAFPLLRDGFDLTATDVSPEAVAYCRKKDPAYADRFRVFDCLKDDDPGRYRFIYAVAVVHMLLSDRHRERFYALSASICQRTASL